MTAQQFIYGYHAVFSMLQYAPKQALALYLQTSRRDNKRLAPLVELAKSHGVGIDYLPPRDLSRLVGSKVKHQGIVLASSQLPLYNEQDLQEIVTTTQPQRPLLLLILDGVQDPHNLGACLRTANAQAVDAVVIPRHAACGVTAVVRKVACGAAEATPVVQVANLARCLQMLKKEGVWLVGLDAQGTSPLADIELTGHMALVLGSEGQGMRRLSKEHCDYLAYIPMHGVVESLNVSASCAMSLYEVSRQRGLQSAVKSTT